MKPRSTAIIVTIAAVLGACLWLVPASGASTATVVEQCAEGRAASYKLKASDAAFLKRYLNCVLSADGLHADPNDTIDVPGKSYVITTPRGAAGGYKNVPVSFAKYMAPTVADFAKASESDENWKYVDRRSEPPMRRPGTPFLAPTPFTAIRRRRPFRPWSRWPPGLRRHARPSTSRTPLWITSRRWRSTWWSSRESGSMTDTARTCASSC